MPRIIIFAQRFPPEIHPTAVMVRELAEHLVVQGWTVTVLTGFPHHGPKELYGEVRRQLLRREQVGGVTVLRGWHTMHAKRTMLTRASQFGTKALSSTLLALGLPRPDCVLSFGPPLLGPLLAGSYARAVGAGFVNVIHDLHPDIAIALGKLRDPFTIGVARVVERAQYRLAQTTVVLSEGFRQALLDRGVPAERVAIVRLWLDPDEIRPGPRDNAWRREHDLPPDKCVVLYAGTIGQISGAELLVDVAATLQHRDDIVLLLVGDGDAKDAVQRGASARGLRNLRFEPYQARERLPELQSASDVSLVTLLPGRGRTSVPSKVIGYLAAGRPVLASVDADSDTARDLALAGAGVVTPPGDADALAAAILELADDEARRADLGAAARRHFETHYARPAVLHRFGQVLTAAARASGSSGSVA